MAIESVTHIDDLNPAYPESDDPKSEGDDHIRNLKTAIKATFPNLTGAMTLTQAVLNALPALVDTKGAIAGQTWTGSHTFPATTYGVTAAFGSTGTKLATIDYVNAVALNAALPGQSGKAGKFLRSDGTTAAWADSIPTITVYTSSTTWVADVPRIRVTVVGGGGSSGTNLSNTGFGGSAGGTAIKTLDVTVGETYTITVGAGGAAIVAEGAGNTGGTSSFSGASITTVSATGGAGGPQSGFPAAGGVGTGGDINLSGGTASATGANSGFSDGGASYLSPGAPYNTNATGYGAGAGGVVSSATGKAGAPGVVIIEKA